MNWGRGTEDEHRMPSRVAPGGLPSGDRWTCSGDNETAHRLSSSSSFSDALFLPDLRVGIDHLLQGGLVALAEDGSDFRAAKGFHKQWVRGMQQLSQLSLKASQFCWVLRPSQHTWVDR